MRHIPIAWDSRDSSAVAVAEAENRSDCQIIEKTRVGQREDRREAERE